MIDMVIMTMTIIVSTENSLYLVSEDHNGDMTNTSGHIL
jgi:hypothetical protein